jgi:tRNA(Ile)-lysidine synthase
LPPNLKNPGNLENQANLYWYPLSIPGEVQLVESGCLVSAEEAQVAPAGGVTGNQAMAVVQLNRSGGPLAVRNRRPGDKFRPLGLGGGKKLQDFFVDRKIARERRDAVPLVVDESDRIIWVAGLGIDEQFRVRDPAQAVVILRLKLLGESV